MILMIDNYDSFTYNLVQYLGELGEELIVRRNDEITIEQIEELAPDFLMISPGRAVLMKRGSASKRSNILPAVFLFSAYVSGISRLRKYSAAMSSERSGSCTAKRQKLCMTDRRFLKACKIRLSPPGTIHLLSKRTRCRIVLRYPLKPKKEKLWQSAIMSCLLKVCSSIRNPS